MTAPARSDADALRTRARAWIAGDPDEATRAELEALVEADDVDALRAAVGGALTFGTAGLRGTVGPGSLRMNRAVVIRTTRGLADHLAAEGLGDRPVVVGFDARPDSRRFAGDVVAVLLAAGFAVAAYPDPAPTPLIAFGVLHLHAAAGVVVTASHNPPAYNGYKVYAANGAQIVPPADADIAAAIAAVGPAAEVPRAAEEWTHPRVTHLGEAAVAAYVDALTHARPTPPARTELRFAYTPLHGVGWATLQRVLGSAGHDVVAAPEQVEPDGRFPTVEFPNPEEPGALDLVRATADERGADVILANDPDADRLAVAVADPAGGWRALTGDQIGVLLGDYLLAHAEMARTPLVVSTIVSSPMLADVAASHGARHEVTLTGFKWICNAALTLERTEALDFVFGYEEALGYTVGTAVRDKDGIGAAAAFADLASWLAASGRSVLDRLGELYRDHGLWVSVQRNVTRDGPEGRRTLDAAMARLGDEVPGQLAGRKVRQVTDYRVDAETRAPWLGATPLVALEVDGGRVLVRPSGTEPKLKAYADLRGDLTSTDDWMARERELREDADAIAADVLRFLDLA